VLTTGCNYGSRAMESSITASNESLQELTRCQSKIGTTKQAAARLLRGMRTAHDAIIKGSQDIFTETEVQIFCGMACRLPNLQNSLNSDWIFICANLGNIKAFHWSYRTKKLKEITTGNESLELSGKNIGGKIGGSVTESGPELSNLRVYSQYCDDAEKDIIILMTPLVYYNHDPEVMGFSTKEFFDSKPSSKKKDKKIAWSKIPAEQRAKIRLKTIEKALQRAPKEDASSFVDVLVQNTLSITNDRREYLKTNIDQEKQMEEFPYSKMRGKMGQVTCAAFRVGQLIESSSTTTDRRNDISTTTLRIADSRASVFYQMRPTERKD